MSEKNESKEMEKAYKEWEERIGENSDLLDPEGKKYITDSDIPIKPLYTPRDLEAIGFDYLKNLGFPGSYPCTRGNRSAGYREAGIRTKQYIGFGSAEETNSLYKYMIKEGNQVISMAYDLPTQSGHDSDDPRVLGEIGKIGVLLYVHDHRAPVHGPVRGGPDIDLQSLFPALEIVLLEIPGMGVGCNDSPKGVSGPEPP